MGEELLNEEGNDYLNILEIPSIDTDIEQFEYIEQDSDQSQGNLNSQTEITISFQNQDAWMLPHKSYLILEGTLRTEAAANWNDAAGTGIGFINNGLMYMFKTCKYFLGNQQIEYFEDAGITTTIHNLLTRSKNFQGLHLMWYPDNHNGEAAITNTGFANRRDYLRNAANSFKFSAIVPLSHIFNFANDYKKVIYGMQHKIALTRTNDFRAIMKNNNADDAGDVLNFVAGTAVAVARIGSINLTKLRWAMPVVKPSENKRIELTTIIKDKTPVVVSFLNKKYETIAVPHATTFSWKLQIAAGIEKPRFIVLAFQTARAADDELTNHGTFDPLDVTNAYILLNGVRYPYADVGTNLTNNVYAKWYHNYLEFRKMYTGEDNGDSCVGLLEFKSIYPLYVFDVSHQSEKLKNTVIDITIHMSFAAAAADGTIAHAVTYCDSLFKLTGDSNKQIIQLF